MHTPVIVLGKSEYGRSWSYSGSCWPEVLMPSGNIFFGAWLLTSCFDSSCGAVGTDEVRAGAIVSIRCNAITTRVY
jgi:hypothetical protein